VTATAGVLAAEWLSMHYRPCGACGRAHIPNEADRDELASFLLWADQRRSGADEAIASYIVKRADEEIRSGLNPANGLLPRLRSHVLSALTRCR
jgi:hypothetical protein